MADHKNVPQIDNTDTLAALVPEEIGAEIRVMLTTGSSVLKIIPPLPPPHNNLDAHPEAFEVLFNSQSARSIRDRIHLIISISPQTGNAEHDQPANRLSFLASVKNLPTRPYIAAIPSRDEIPYQLETYADIVSMPNANPEELARRLGSNVREFWYGRPGQEVHLEFKETEELFPSRFTPFPTPILRKFNAATHNHNLLTQEEQPKGLHAIAVIDNDGTLFESEDPDAIILDQFAQFLLDEGLFQKGSKNMFYLRELLEYCDEWKEDRRLARQLGSPLKVDYQTRIKHSANLSALAFKGMQYTELQRLGYNFVQLSLKGQFYEYVPEVLRILKEHGITPVLVTGMPDFLVPPILEKVGMNFGNGMTYKLDSNGCLTGEVKTNMGIAIEKALHAEKLRKLGTVIPFGMGDSEGDGGLVSAAVHKATGKHDVPGGAMLVNATGSVVNAFKTHYVMQMEKDGRFQAAMLNDDGSNPAASKVIAGVQAALRSTFYPSAEYMELRRYPHSAEYRKFMDRFNDPEETDRLFAVLETVKRMRDIWVRLGKSQSETKEILLHYFPKPLVDAAIKDHIHDHKRIDDFKAWLTEIGCRRESIADVMNCIDQDNQKKGIQPIRHGQPTPMPFPAVSINTPSPDSKK